MELEKIADTLMTQDPRMAQKLDRELEKLLAVLEETGTSVLGDLEKARYRKEKDPEKIKELRRAYRILRKEIEQVEACRERFGSLMRAAKGRQAKERIDYDQFRVDETVAYSLKSVITNKKPAGFSLCGTRYEAGSWKQVLLYTCAALNRMDPMLFASLEKDPDLQGRRRPFFSGNGDGLDTPAKVPDADVFVETHVSARYLSKMIRRLLGKFGIPEEEYMIFLRKDFTALHAEKEEVPFVQRPALKPDSAGDGTEGEAPSPEQEEGVLRGQMTMFDWEDGDWEETGGEPERDDELDKTVL